MEISRQPFWNTSVFHEVLQAYKKRVDLSLKNKILSWISEKKYKRSVKIYGFWASLILDRMMQYVKSVEFTQSRLSS